jgi:putative SOS response-associated peptidase YedK
VLRLRQGVDHAIALQRLRKTQDWEIIEMCGRFTLRSKAADVAKAFGLLEVPDVPPRFNIAPTQGVPIVRVGDDGNRGLSFAHWGLIPSWAEDPAIGNRMINARADTVATKPSFRTAYKKRRCLLVADGFYEWQKTGAKKQPYYIRLKDDGPFAFAGLWERWKRDDKAIESCTIITTDANELMQPIHDRMPVILQPDAYELWLDPAVQEPERLQPLLRPFAAGEMAAYPVSTVVNSPRNERAECVEKLS